MADIAINPVTRRVQFTGNTGTGPFAFTFNILADEDIVVYKNTTLLTLTTDYTVATNADGTGSVTLVAALIASDVLTIIGGRELERTTDFVTAGDLLAASLNEQLDSIVIMAQQLDEKLGRSLKVNPGDVFTDLELPGKDARKGTVMAFNATSGDPEAGPEIADVSSIASITADIATLADIEDGTDATDAIQTVAGISGNVTTVAGISSDVTTVAGITGNIASVVADEADIGVVAGISGDVSTVSAISTDVTTVAADGTDIGVVAGISSDVTTVSGISADVTTVSSISSDVTTVVGNAASITTVAGNSSNVTIVADNITDVNTVASNIGSITTKVSKSGDTMTGNLLFDDTSKVLLGTRSNLQIYHSATAITASNITLYFTNGSTSGTMEITDTDHTISVSDTVRVDSPEILNSTPVTVSGVVLSSLQQDLTVSATTATTFTVPVTYASDPGTTGTLSQAGTYYYYTGSATSYISEQGAGSLHVLGSEINVYNADETSQLAQFSTTATKLFHDNSEKLTTTATGISLPEDLTVQGNLTVQGTTITVDSATAQTIDLGDGDRMRFGDSNDAYIEWNGTYFDLRSTGRFDLLSSGNDLRLSTATNVGLIVNHTGGSPAVQLYNSGVERLATTSTGVDITGTLTSDGLTVDTDTLHVDAANNRVGIGTSSPSRTLEVAGEEYPVVRVNSNASTGGPAVYFGREGTDQGFVGLQGHFAGTSSNDLYLRAQTGNNMLFLTNGNNERMRIDSSGNVGIGTSSPSTKVEISGAGFQTLSVTSTNSSPVLKLNSAASSVAYLQWNNAGSSPLSFYDLTASAERMRIDSSGNVIVGGTTAVNSNASTGNITINGSGNAILNFTVGGAAKGWFYHDGTNFEMYNNVSGSNKFFTNGSERMRIDSSGNLLVNLTSDTDGTNVGVRARADGFLAATREGSATQPTAYFNKKTNDGDIVGFYKDGTTVGSIGSFVSGSRLYFAGGSSALTVLTNQFYPATNTGAAADGTMDMGSNGARFKDLYLSGGVYLGGTGSANKLDDYEEGTWTPTLTSGPTLSAANGRYTKVGNTVYVMAKITRNDATANTNAFELGGLPFTPDNSNPSSANGLGVAASYNGTSDRRNGIINSSNGNTVFIIETGTTVHVTYDDFIANTRTAEFKWFYYTTA